MLLFIFRTLEAHLAFSYIRLFIERASLDFRVGVEGYFDPDWQMLGTTADHSRKKITI